MKTAILLHCPHFQRHEEDCSAARTAVGWKCIAAEMEVGVGTLYRVALEGSKIWEKVF